MFTGTVLPGYESDILKLSSRRRQAGFTGGGDSSCAPKRRGAGFLCRSLRSSAPLLSSWGRRVGGVGPREKVAFVSPANVFIRKGFSRVHVPDLSQPRSSGFRTTIWTAAQADLIRYLSRAAALHAAEGGPSAGPCCRPRAWRRPPPL